MLVRTLCQPDLVVTDTSLRPRFWATAWVGGLGGTSLARSSSHQQLRHLNSLYEFCDSRFGEDSLDAAISFRDVQGLQNMAEAFYLHLTSDDEYTTTSVQCWGVACAFIRFISRRFATKHEAWAALDSYLGALRRMRAPKTGRFKYVRALPDSTLRDLLDVSAPESNRNPFSSAATRLRNWLIVNLLLLCGLRRGEALLLKVTSLQTEVDPGTGEVVRWLDVTTSEDDEDERATRPSIKTEESHRQIPVSESLAAVYEQYVAEGRTDSPDHDFLLTSRDGKPLSAESVNKAFEKFTRVLSPQAVQRFRERTGNKQHISPHDLRHTCATARYRIFIRQDADRELALQRMRAFFGWSRTSEMPDVYARAAIQDDLLTAWSELFDRRVADLRALA